MTIAEDERNKLCKVWFYGENQHIRNKTNILTLNESASEILICVNQEKICLHSK